MQVLTYSDTCYACEDGFCEERHYPNQMFEYEREILPSEILRCACCGRINLHPCPNAEDTCKHCGAKECWQVIAKSELAYPYYDAHEFWQKIQRAKFE